MHATPQHPYSLSSSSITASSKQTACRLTLPYFGPSRIPTLENSRPGCHGAEERERPQTAWLLPRGAVFGQGIRWKIYSVTPVLLEGLGEGLLCKYASGLSVLSHWFVKSNLAHVHSSVWFSAALFLSIKLSGVSSLWVSFFKFKLNDGQLSCW